MSISDLPLIPTGYERLLPPTAQMAVHARRRDLAARAQGRVLDLGGSESHRTMYRGTGPDEVEVLDGPDLDAVTALADAGRRFDHVVSVCTIVRAEDESALLGAVGRLLDDDGRLLFVEPVPTGGRLRPLSRLAGPIAQVAGGFHLGRDPVQSIRDADLTICDVRRDRIAALRWPFHHLASGSARRTRPPMVDTEPLPGRD